MRLLRSVSKAQSVGKSDTVSIPLHHDIGNPHHLHTLKIGSVTDGVNPIGQFSLF